jgi:hypothetical protein
MIRNLFIKVTAGLMVLACSQSFAGTNYWQNFDGKIAPSRHAMTVTTKDYTVFSLNQNAMKNFLSNVGTDPNQAQAITIPSPDHKFMNFHIWKTPMMEKALSDKYPDIQTFTAVSDDDPSVTAKIEYTMFGFSALVYNGPNTFFIDAYNKDVDGYYVAYYKRDFYSTIQSVPCMVTEADQIKPADNGIPTEVNTGDADVTGNKVNGSVRHTYRLALSCTGEYAIAVGGANPTVSQILTIMSVTVDRINGYYEREFSVSMNLIGNNDAIIFLDPTTDPYACNNNLNCLIGEVGTTIGNVIGDANYDIGHILCTAGGGLAQLSAVCGGGKARGTSSSGGSNDIHVPLHEMGHQFGSNHTFSANTGGCNGNRGDATAYEPGGGISTMSYSGLCDPNNVGGPSDDYFHVSSLLEIGNFLTGQGSSCGTTATGTNPITVPDIKDTFYIPRNTPFELTAPIVTAPTNPLQTAVLFNWEQWDVLDVAATPDPVEANAANAAKGPLFKSYYPTTSRIRSYPEYTNINASTYGDGATGAGQRISKVSRDINFKLSVRSIYQGWGTFRFMDNTVYLKTDPNVHDFRATEPSADETWNPGETKTVKWVVPKDEPTVADSVKCNWVNIYLSYDNGQTYPRVLVSNANGTAGSYTFTVPADIGFSTEGRVKVKGVGNAYFDVAKGKLSINGTVTGIPKVGTLSNVSIYPNPANNQITVSNKTAGTTLKLVMYNIIGQQVWTGQVKDQTNIEVGSFARGNYLIQVLNENTGERSAEKVVLK